MRKTSLVTGANSGIGFETARGLARAGHRVILTSRNTSAGVAALSRIKDEFPSADLELIELDLHDFASIEKAAERVRSLSGSLDTLINNAGYFAAGIYYTNDIENTLYASHLGHMLLTLKLSSALNRSEDGRVITLSSALHKQGNPERFFRKVPGYTPMQAYADAKLANLLFAMALARKGHSFCSWAVHPGVVRTNFDRDVTGWFKIAISLFKPFFISAEQGAATSLHLATHRIEDLRGFNGGYFEKSAPSRDVSRFATPERAEAFYQQSEKLLQKYL